MKWVLKNVFTGESILINSNQFIIGRDKDYDICCKSTLVSRLHAKIYTLSTGNLQIVNYSNSNGTYINNKKIFDKELEEGDEIGFGLCRLDGFHEAYKPPYYIFILKRLVDEPIINIESDDQENDKIIPLKVDNVKIELNKISTTDIETEKEQISILSNIKINGYNFETTVCENKSVASTLINNHTDHYENNKKEGNIYTVKTSEIKMQKNDSSKEFVDNDNVKMVENSRNSKNNQSKTKPKKISTICHSIPLKVHNDKIELHKNSTTPHNETNKEILMLSNIKTNGSNSERIVCENNIIHSTLISSHNVYSENNKEGNIYTVKASEIKMQKNDSSKEFVDNDKYVKTVKNRKKDKSNTKPQTISTKTIDSNVIGEDVDKTVDIINENIQNQKKNSEKNVSGRKRVTSDKVSPLGMVKKKKICSPIQKELRVVLNRINSEVIEEKKMNNQNISSNIEVDNQLNRSSMEILPCLELDMQEEQTDVMKEPPTCTTTNRTNIVSSNNLYSCDDNIIVIDDDEDDNFDFVCSQLFVKSEPTEKISDELFMDIKKEVAEMDEYEDNSKLPAILINDSMDCDDFSFDDDDELLKELNCAINDKNYKPLPNNVDISSDQVSKDIYKKQEPSTSRLHNNKKNEPTNRVNKQVQIIEAKPLQITSKKKEERRTTSKNKEEDKSKRKYIGGSKSSKRTKTNVKDKIIPGKMLLDEETKIARKEKLKKITEKEAISKPRITTDKQNKPNTRVKIKVSSGRGGFLLQQNEENKYDATVKNKNNSKDVNKPVIQTKLPLSNGSFKVPTFPNNTGAYSSYSNYRSKLRQTPNLLEEYWDIIEPMINWNVNWFEEYKVLKTPPPVTKSPVIRMCNTFSCFKDYKVVLEQLLLLNYWFTVGSAYEETIYNRDNSTRNPFVGIIKKYMMKDTHSELQCITYLTSEQNKWNDHLKEKSLVLVNVRVKGNQKKYKTLFGVVSWISKEKLTGQDKIDSQTIQMGEIIPTTKLTFLLIVKKCDQLLTDQHVCIRYFIEYSFLLKMISAIRAVEKSPLLRHILEPREKDYFVPYDNNRELKIKRDLNNIQLDAIIEARYLTLKKDCGIYLIGGPPGTGKSSVIQSILLEVISNISKKECVLLLAPSNGAIDSLINTFLTNIRRIYAGNRNFIKLVRVGANISKNLKRYSLESLAAYNLKNALLCEHPQVKNDYNILCADLYKLKQEMKSKPSSDTMSKVNEKLKEIENFPKNYLKFRYQEKFEEHKINVLQSANILCSTLGSAHNIYVRGCKHNINLCIVDEATQCSEPESLIPIKMGVKKLILVGDPQQLPAVTSSIMSKEFGYDKSLFTRLSYTLSKSQKNPIKTLNIQYRMNPEINSYPNRKFYNGQVQDAPNFIVKKGLEKLAPYIVFDRNQPFTTDHYQNLYEVNYIILLVQSIINNIKIEEELSIGIITPYTKQKDAINHALTQQTNLTIPNLKITCNTVDSFQGQEKDIIILSTVRNSPNIFSQDLQRLNVALTRAKYALYIIGSIHLFNSCKVLTDLKEDAKARNVYHSLTEDINSPAAFSKFIIK